MSGRNIGVRKYVVRLSEDEQPGSKKLFARQKSGETIVESANLIKGRRFRTRRRLERRGNHRGVDRFIGFVSNWWKWGSGRR